jgi:hypothetical protein
VGKIKTGFRIVAGAGALGSALWYGPHAINKVWHDPALKNGPVAVDTGRGLDGHVLLTPKFSKSQDGASALALAATIEGQVGDAATKFANHVIRDYQHPPAGHNVKLMTHRNGKGPADFVIVDTNPKTHERSEATFAPTEDGRDVDLSHLERITYSIGGMTVTAEIAGNSDGTTSWRQSGMVNYNALPELPPAGDMNHLYTLQSQVAADINQLPQ